MKSIGPDSLRSGHEFSFQRVAMGLSRLIYRTTSRRLSRAGRVQAKQARLGIYKTIQLCHGLGMRHNIPLFSGTESFDDGFEQL
jgi:hypothetical protein